MISTQSPHYMTLFLFISTLLILFFNIPSSTALTCEPICSFNLDSTICPPQQCTNIKCNTPNPCKYTCDTAEQQELCDGTSITPLCRVACTSKAFDAIDINRHCQVQCAVAPEECSQQKGCSAKCAREEPQCKLACNNKTINLTQDECHLAIPLSQQRYPLECRQHSSCVLGGVQNGADSDIADGDLEVFDDEQQPNEGHFDDNDDNVDHVSHRNVQGNDGHDGDNVNKKNNGDKKDRILDPYGLDDLNNSAEEGSCDDDDEFEHDAKEIEEQRQKEIEKKKKEEEMERKKEHKISSSSSSTEYCCSCQDVANLTLSYNSALKRVMKSTSDYDDNNIPSLKELIQYYHHNGFEKCCECAKK